MTYIYPNKHIHLTSKDLGSKVTLHPSKNYTPEGVSFAPSIKQAINALPVFYSGEDVFVKKELPNIYVEREYTFYVYTPVKKYEAIIPKTADDVDVSGERRVLGNVDAKLISKILVTSNETKSGKTIHYLDYEKHIIRPYSENIINKSVDKKFKRRKIGNKIRITK